VAEAAKVVENSQRDINENPNPPAMLGRTE